LQIYSIDPELQRRPGRDAKRQLAQARAFERDALRAM
jgi:hypothetical protein